MSCHCNKFRSFESPNQNMRHISTCAGRSHFHAILLTLRKFVKPATNLWLGFHMVTICNKCMKLPALFI